jgi:hypothetical protein
MIATTLLLVTVLGSPGATPRAGSPTGRERTPAQPGVEAGSAAPSDSDVRERVETYLGAIDRPVSSSAWRALGPAAIPHLEAVLASSELPTRRAKAATGLAAIGGDRARAALLARAKSEQDPFVVRSAAMRGAARLATKDELVSELTPVLGARSAHVRAVAAEVLAGAGDAGGCAAVRAQAAREGKEGAARYGKALSRCPAR